jgi:hypothetical protein
MADGLDDLCVKISLIAGEKIEKRIIEGEVVDVQEVGGRSLLGRIEDMRKVNKEDFKSILSRIW